MTKKRRKDATRKVHPLKGKEKYKCRICGTSHSLITSYGVQICRRCFREVAEKVGFRKY